MADDYHPNAGSAQNNLLLRLFVNFSCIPDRLVREIKIAREELLQAGRATLLEKAEDKVFGEIADIMNILHG